MLDFDLGKIILVCAVALIVVGPKDLPVALRFFGRMLRQFREVKARLTNDFVKTLDEADIEGVNRSLKSVDDLIRTDMSYNPATAMRSRPAKPEKSNGTATLANKDDAAAKPAYASPEMARYLETVAEPAPSSFPIEPFDEGGRDPGASAVFTASEPTGRPGGPFDA